LYDASSAVYAASLPNVPSGVIAVDRRNSLLAKTLSLDKGAPGTFVFGGPKMPTAVPRPPQAAAAGGAGNGGAREQRAAPSEAFLAWQYAPLVACAQRLLTGVQHLHVRGKLDGYTALNVAREVQDLVRRVVVLSSRERASLRVVGAQIDASLAMLLSWLSREADATALPNDDPVDATEDASKMDPENQRRLRLYVLDLAIAALNGAKDARDAPPTYQAPKTGGTALDAPETTGDGAEPEKTSAEPKIDLKKPTEHSL
jgi:hypothetical protein